MKKASSPFFWFLRAVFRPVLFILYRFKFERKTSRGIKRPCLILSNHQTIFDQFAVGLGFDFGINYVASDTIFRHGLLSKLMIHLSHPIPYSKGSSDFAAIRNMMTVIKGGGCVGMFPSGNRSFFGDECKIVDGIGKLARKFNVPLVLVQVRGGFNTLARWSVKPNKGKMRARVVKIVQPAELAAMTSDEIDKIIHKELSFNEFAHNKDAQVIFRGKRKAEYLESVLFYCPECGSMSGLYSQGNEFFCRDCGARVRINGAGFFEKTRQGGNIPDTILEWSHKQLDYIKNLDFSAYKNQPVFSDGNISFFRAERARSEELLGTGTIEFYVAGLKICGQEFPHAEITTAVHGVRKMSIYSKDGTYAIMAPYRINLVKYMICSYHLRNRALDSKEEFYGY